MCMKNVNVTAFFCDSDLSELGGTVQLGKFIDEIKVTPVPGSDGERNIISNLTIVTFVNAISGTDDSDLIKEYDMLWTFEPMGEDKSERKQIASDILDVKKNKFDQKNVTVCRSFSNQILKFTLRDFEVTAIDKPYWLKIFMRETGQQQYQIQSINTIKVVNCIE